VEERALKEQGWWFKPDGITRSFPRAFAPFGATKARDLGRSVLVTVGAFGTTARGNYVPRGTQQIETRPRADGKSSGKPIFDHFAPAVGEGRITF
jgi:hypothetical protein